MKKDAILYSLKIWITCTLLFPLISRFAYNFERNYIPIKFWEISGLLDYIKEDLILGIGILTISLPFFLFFGTGNILISIRARSIFHYKKLIHSFWFLAFILFLFFNPEEWLTFSLLFLILTISIWFFKTIVR